MRFLRTHSLTLSLAALLALCQLCSLTKIKEYGYVLRYVLGQYPSFTMVGDRLPYQRFYLREDVCPCYKKQREMNRQSRAVMSGLISSLQKKGVTVVILPIPSKVAVERAHISKRLPSCVLWGSLADSAELLEEDATANYEELVAADPAHVVNLNAVYEQWLRAHPDDYLYVPSDSHWSSLGIALAAKAVVDKLGGAEPAMTLVKPVATQGEFIGYLQLPSFFVKRSPELQWQEPLHTLSASRGGTRGRVLVFGTSYAERLKETEWGLGSLLGKTLGREVVDLSFHGAGPIGSFIEFQKKGLQYKKGDIVVWEFPVRHPPSAAERIPLG